MLIRKMTPGDVVPLAHLMAGDPLWQRYSVTEADAARRLGDGLAKGANIAVAEEDGEAAGFIWTVERGSFARSGYIMLIGVQAGRRGSGIGRALMAHAEAELFAAATDVFLLVSDFNEAAQSFYQHLGYSQAGALEDYVVPGVTELIYRKRRPMA